LDNPVRRNHLEDQGVKTEANIKVNVREIDCEVVKRTELVQNRVI
jgi:hypothetical protein